ncbi:DUF1294 domain-containing protein [Cupriavidus necator]
MPWYVRGYLVLINLISFGAFVYDKIRALRDEWRIPERRLHFLTIGGGVFGSGMGMFLAKHKVSKPVFYVMLILGFFTFLGIMKVTDVHPDRAASQTTDTKNERPNKSEKHSRSIDKHLPRHPVER